MKEQHVGQVRMGRWILNNVAGGDPVYGNECLVESKRGFVMFRPNIGITPFLQESC